MSKHSEGHREATAGLPDLRGALNAIPGCLGTEVARTESGKEVIFAWFEEKRARSSGDITRRFISGR